MWVRRSWCAEWLSVKLRTCFDHGDPVIHREVFEQLHQSIRPANGRAENTVIESDAEAQLFCVLRKKAGTCLNELSLAPGMRLHCNHRTNRVAVALGATQPKRN